MSNFRDALRTAYEASKTPKFEAIKKEILEAARNGCTQVWFYDYAEIEVAKIFALQEGLSTQYNSCNPREGPSLKVYGWA